MSQSTTGAVPTPASQARLGDLLGMSSAMVSRLLSGERLPSVDTIAAVRSVLGWSAEDQVTAYVADAYASGLKDAWARYQQTHRL